jgi:hypothetical protein
MFRRKASPPYAGPKRKPSKKQEEQAANRTQRQPMRAKQTNCAFDVVRVKEL